MSPRAPAAIAAMLLFLAACTGAPRATPETGPAAPGAAPLPVPSLPTAAGSIFLRPATVRYAIHRRVSIQQELAGDSPSGMSYTVFVTSRLAAPIDTTLYEAVHTVDSVVADSGSFVPPTLNLAAARGIQFTGRLTPAGRLTQMQLSDSVVGRTYAQVVSSLQGFYPQLPASGLRPGSYWIDTLSWTEVTGGGHQRVEAITHHRAAGMESRSGVPSIRIAVTADFSLEGAGELFGQQYNFVGIGTRVGAEYVSLDGRYLGGELRDSTRRATNLLAQGITVTTIEMVNSRVNPLP